MTVFASWLGDGGGEGISDKGMTAVVTKEAASNTSYNCHYQRNATSDLNGLKVRITNTMAAGGGILPVWAQIIGFTDEEMPPDKIPCGFIILKVPRLSASISENSFGYIVLMRKGVGIETAMFAMYEKVVIMPEVSRVRHNIAGVDDETEEVPDYLHTVLSTDSGMTQLKALQDPEALREKTRKNIDQIKYAKQASEIQQPCDAGNTHVHQRHHSKHVSLSDIPEMSLLNVISEQLQYH